MMDWSATEDALQAAVARVSGLTGDRVRWSRASRDQPASTGDVIVLECRDEQTDGPEFEFALVPGGGSPGEELEYSTTEQVDFRLVVDVYSMVVGGAWSRLARVRRSIWLQSAQDELTASNLAFVDSSNPIHLPILLETEYRDRAWMEIRVRAVDGASELGTFIETAEIGDNL